MNKYKKSGESAKPPRIAEYLLSLLLSNRDLYRLGDYEEIFQHIAENESRIKAYRWYWLHTIRSIPELIKNKIYWSVAMFNNYFKIAIRNIKRYKAYSLINIFGLALGITCSLLIYMYVNQELSYDNYHFEKDRVFRVYEEISSPTASKKYIPVAWPVAPTLLSEFPQVEYAARLYTHFSARLVKYDNSMFFEPKFLFGEKDIFKILTFNFIQGNPNTALLKPNTIILTETTAQKYCGQENPMGKIIQVNNENFEITGVIEDLPFNTHLKFDLMASLESIVNERWLSNWYGTECFTYIKVSPNVNIQELRKNMLSLADKYISEEVKSRGKFYKFYLQQVSDIHLNSNFVGELEPPGNIYTIILFSAIGILVLLIASLNYMNLSTAKSLNRAKEIGLRKVIGGNRKQIIIQFYSESILFTFLSIIFAAVITISILPYFNELAGIIFKITDLFKPKIIASLLLISLFIGFGAGSYIAIFLSSFEPVTSLKGSFNKSDKGSFMRKSMVIFQFSISILLIIGTLVIYRQIYYMKNHQLGFEKEHKIIIPVRGGVRITKNYEQIKNVLGQHPNILSIAASSTVPGKVFYSWNLKTIDKKPQFDDGMNHLFIDPEFIPTYDIKLLAGRNFQQDISTDLADWSKRINFIINEAALKSFGLNNPKEALGLQIKSGLGNLQGLIIGVTHNFHYAGLQSTIEPLIIEWFPHRFRYLTLKVNSTNISETMTYLKTKWSELFPNVLFDSYFLDEKFNSLYQSEEQTAKIARSFTMIGIFIAIIGLLGLVSFITEQKRKEIGIRKVLGSSTSGIINLLSKEFIKWVVIANLIAWPTAYFTMTIWLQDFAFRTNLDIGIFIFSGILSLLLTLITISYQSIKAAVANPVESLKYE